MEKSNHSKMKVRAPISVALLLVVALIGLQPLVAPDSAYEGHGGPLRSSTSKSAITSPNARVTPKTSLNIKASNDPSKDLTVMFTWALLAFVLSSVTPIYVIFYDREPSEEVPTLNIENMFSFILAAWHGLNAGDTLSMRISCLNGVQAILELAQVGTRVFRNKALFKPSRDISGKVGIPFFLFFGFIQYAAETTARNTLFAICSTLSSLIMLILPIFTLRDELRCKPKERATFFCSTVLQLVGNVIWLGEGIVMRDIYAEITSSAGILAGLAALLVFLRVWQHR